MPSPTPITIHACMDTDRTPNQYELLLTAQLLLGENVATIGNRVYGELYPQGYRLHVDGPHACMVQEDSPLFIPPPVSPP